MLKFSKTHEWAKIENDIALIGISDHAQSELGDVVFVEVPQKGASLKQNSPIATVESTKAAAEIFSPLSGEIVEVNDELAKNPQWINGSSMDKGWIAKIKVSDLKEADSLMDEAAYETYINQEKD